MDKRGQLSSFIIIGLLFVAAFAFLYFINYLQSGEVEPILFSIGLSSEVNSFKENVDACLEQTTKEGLDYFGVKESSEILIEHYIEAELKDCIDYESFEELGLDIEAGSADARVLITEESVLVDLNYPVTIKKKDAVTRLNNFNYYVEREKEGILSFDANQETMQTQTIVTEDGDAELTIPAGTKVIDAEGNLINEVSLKILDRNFEGLNNDVVIGMVVYEGLPDGARFEPPVTLVLNYRDGDIPYGVDESNLGIAWYDKERGIWKTVPNSAVDTVNNKVTAKISHFTQYSIVSDYCIDIEENEQTIRAGIVYKEPCRICTSETVFKDPIIYFTGTSVVPYDEDGDGEVDSEGEPFGEGCVGPKDCDEDDRDADGIKDGTKCSPQTQQNNCNLPATPKTYGYNNFVDVGGTGVFTFYVDESGESCEALDSNNEPIVKINVETLEGDTVSVELNGAEIEEGEIKGGVNTLTVKVNNDNKDACAEASVTITMTGFGLLRECEKDAEITKNCHCGYTNVNLKQGEKLYCCENGNVVEKKEDCELAPEGSVGITCSEENEGVEFSVGEKCTEEGVKQIFVICEDGWWRISKEVLSADQNCQHTELGTECGPLTERHRQAGDESGPLCKQGEKEIWEKCQNGYWVQYPTTMDCGTNPYFPREMGLQKLPPAGVTPPEKVPKAEQVCCCPKEDLQEGIYDRCHFDTECITALELEKDESYCEGAEEKKECSGYDYSGCRKEGEGACFCGWTGTHEGGVCKPIEGSPEGSTCEAFGKVGSCDADGKCVIDPCTGMGDGYHCKDADKYLRCKDGKTDLGPTDCPEGETCKGEGPAGSYTELCEKEEEKPEFIPRNRDGSLNVCDPGDIGCVSDAPGSFTGCCGRCRDDGTWDTGWICTRPCSYGDTERCLPQELPPPEGPGTR